MRQRRYWLILAAIVFAAFALRLSIAIGSGGFSAAPGSGPLAGEAQYEALGWRLASGLGYTDAEGNPTALLAPGTPVLIETIYILFGRSPEAARCVFCLLSALTCLVAGMLAAEMFGPFAGLCAALLLALLPSHAAYASLLVPEVPYALAITIACLWMVLSRQESNSWPLDLGAGLMLAFCFLTRPQSAASLPLFALLALFGATRTRSDPLRRFARVGFVFALVSVPWLVRNEWSLGTLEPSTSTGQSFWGAHNEVIAADRALVGGSIPVERLSDAAHPLPLGEAARSAAAWGYGLEYVRGHAGELPRLLFWKLVRQYWPFGSEPAPAFSWLVLAPLCIAGIVIGLRRARMATCYLLVPILASVVAALLLHGEPSIRDGEVGICAVLAAAAISTQAPKRWKTWVGEPG